MLTQLQADFPYLIVVFSLGMLCLRRLRLKAESLDVNLLFLLRHLRMKVGRLNLKIG